MTIAVIVIICLLQCARVGVAAQNDDDAEKNFSQLGNNFGNEVHNLIWKDSDNKSVLPVSTEEYNEENNIFSVNAVTAAPRNNFPTIPIKLAEDDSEAEEIPETTSKPQRKKKRRRHKHGKRKKNRSEVESSTEKLDGDFPDIVSNIILETAALEQDKRLNLSQIDFNTNNESTQIPFSSERNPGRYDTSNSLPHSTKDNLLQHEYDPRNILEDHFKQSSSYNPTSNLSQSLQENGLLEEKPSITSNTLLPVQTETHSKLLVINEREIKPEVSTITMEEIEYLQGSSEEDEPINTKVDTNFPGVLHVSNLAKQESSFDGSRDSPEVFGRSNNSMYNTLDTPHKTPRTPKSLSLIDNFSNPLTLSQTSLLPVNSTHSSHVISLGDNEGHPTFAETSEPLMASNSAAAGSMHLSKYCNETQCNENAENPVNSNRNTTETNLQSNESKHMQLQNDEKALNQAQTSLPAKKKKTKKGLRDKGVGHLSRSLRHGQSPGWWEIGEGVSAEDTNMSTTEAPRRPEQATIYDKENTSINKPIQDLKPLTKPPRKRHHNRSSTLRKSKKQKQPQNNETIVLIPEAKEHENGKPNKTGPLPTKPTKKPVKNNNFNSSKKLHKKRNLTTESPVQFTLSFTDPKVGVRGKLNITNLKNNISKPIKVVEVKTTPAPKQEDKSKFLSSATTLTTIKPAYNTNINPNPTTRLPKTPVTDVTFKKDPAAHNTTYIIGRKGSSRSRGFKESNSKTTDAVSNDTFYGEIPLGDSKADSKGVGNKAIGHFTAQKHSTSTVKHTNKFSETEINEIKTWKKKPKLTV